MNASCIALLSIKKIYIWYLLLKSYEMSKNSHPTDSNISLCQCFRAQLTTAELGTCLLRRVESSSGSVWRRVKTRNFGAGLLPGGRATHPSTTGDLQGRCQAMMHGLTTILANCPLLFLATDVTGQSFRLDKTGLWHDDQPKLRGSGVVVTGS